MVTTDRTVRDKWYSCDAVKTVIKTYRYMVYVEIFVTVNCGAVRCGADRNIWSLNFK